MSIGKRLRDNAGTHFAASNGLSPHSSNVNDSTRVRVGLDQGSPKDCDAQIETIGQPIVQVPGVANNEAAFDTGAAASRISITWCDSHEGLDTKIAKLPDDGIRVDIPCPFIIQHDELVVQERQCLYQVSRNCGRAEAATDMQDIT